jgi:serine protease Do
LIAQVGGGSPAERAGLESGDIIVEVDGESIEVSADLPHVVGLLAPGTIVDVTVIREGESKALRVEIGALEADEVARIETSTNEPGVLRVLGMTLRDAEEADDETAADVRGGAVVVDVEMASPAFEAGIRPNDIVTRFGRTAISRLDDMQQAVDKIDAGDSVPMRLTRQGTPLFIGIKVPEND